MTNLKKASIASIMILLLIIGFAMASFAVNSGTITKEAKLRKTASNDSIILEIIPKKETVEVLEKEGEWYKVRYNKIKGYVLKDYIEVVEVSKEDEVNQTTENEVKIEKGNTITINTKTNLYIRPLINSKVISNIEKGKTVTIEEIRNGWLYIKSEAGSGWIRLNNPSTENKEENKDENTTSKAEELNKTAYISSSGINFREKPNTDSNVLKVFAQNSQVTILEEIDGWYKIKYNDQVGYVVKTYVSNKKVTTTSRSSVNRTQNTNTKKEETNVAVSTSTVASSKGQEVSNYVKQFVGCRYVYGGSTPSGGFDCSGLTMYVYKHYGVSLPHSATSQSKIGTQVSRANLQPGDLIFFKDFRTNKGIGHVGIYIGNNKFVHASTEKTGVITSTLSGTYSSRFVCGTRIF